MQTQCGTLLLKTVELASGRKVFYPFMTYCYLGLQASLQTLLKRPGFSSSCEEWRSRRVKSGVMDDVHEGKICHWNEFQCYNGQPYLPKPRILH